MPLFQKIQPIRSFLHKCKSRGQSVGLVPTMGALHKGHSLLLESSIKDNDVTVCSIFVNPAQFNDPQDLEKYPRNLERDRELIESIGPVVIFNPEVEEIYPEDPLLNLTFGAMDKVMEGLYRKDHFNGVAIVVSKLFNIIEPDRAYFGRKDLQQVSIIERMVRDLSYDIEIIRVPTVRESDGLAFSSRNENLDSVSRGKAVLLYQSLMMARSELSNGADIHQVKQMVSDLFDSETTSLEYFEVVDSTYLEPVEDISADKDIVLCIAANIGNVRLIDNMSLFD